VFFVLAAITLLILIIVIIALPETRQPDPHYSLHPKAIMGNFLEVIKNRQFMTYAMAGNTVSAGLFAYLAGSPYVFMEMHGVSQQAYGWIFGLIAAGLITASQFNNVILKKHKSEKILRTVITIQVILGIIMWTGSWLNFFNLYSLIIIIMLFLSCQGFIFPNAAAMAMAPFSKHAGSAAALMGAIQMALGAFASALVGIFFNSTSMPMVTIMLAFCLTGFTLLVIGQAKLNKEQQ
jgi:DHA1 family bicyclomycin/chloramphenicol resistance-like MFS transporter